VISSDPSCAPTRSDIETLKMRKTTLRCIMPRSEKGSKLDKTVLFKLWMEKSFQEIMLRPRFHLAV
jgi:hypothetical protein